MILLCGSCAGRGLRGVHCAVAVGCRPGVGVSVPGRWFIPISRACPAAGDAVLLAWSPRHSVFR